MKHKMRRADREISEIEALNILDKAEYGILSTISTDNTPYGIPLSFFNTDKKIYFHCAKVGHKLENIKSNPNVSFCAVGQTDLLPEKYSTKFESVIVFGQASEVFEDEKQEALLGLIKKYSPDFYEQGVEYISKAKDATSVYCIRIEMIRGKARR